MRTIGLQSCVFEDRNSGDLSSVVFVSVLHCRSLFGLCALRFEENPMVVCVHEGSFVSFDERVCCVTFFVLGENNEGRPLSDCRVIEN